MTAGKGNGVGLTAGCNHRVCWLYAGGKPTASRGNALAHVEKRNCGFSTTMALKIAGVDRAILSAVQL
jgi:hypothetical protein